MKLVESTFPPPLCFSIWCSQLRAAGCTERLVEGRSRSSIHAGCVSWAITEWTNLRSDLKGTFELMEMLHNKPYCTACDGTLMGAMSMSLSRTITSRWRQRLRQSTGRQWPRTQIAVHIPGADVMLADALSQTYLIDKPLEELGQYCRGCWPHRGGARGGGLVQHTILNSLRRRAWSWFGTQLKTASWPSWWLLWRKDGLRSRTSAPWPHIPLGLQGCKYDSLWK